jgi:uncharacterized protein (DUF1800 family)
MAKLHPLLQEVEFSAGDPWDATKAAHLLARAAWGGKPRDIDAAVSKGLKKTVDDLLDFPDAPTEESSPADQPDFSAIEGYPANPREFRAMLAGKSREERQRLQQQLQMANRQAVGAIISWWLKRMAYGPYPLQERLTFFWHGHFTTSARDERQAMLMWRQQELLRQQSAANFKEFVRQISRDPAMLDYLNNNQNRKSSPNENYARELMELFTLGIGNYTEQDIKESAKAFTGWAHDGEDFIFREREHDTGQKTFMGRTGDFDGDDIIDIIFQQKAAAPYICSRLWTYFAYENAEPELLASLGELLKENNWDFRPVIRTMLLSKAFYSPKAIGTQIKSPVQLVVGLARQLEVEWGERFRPMVQTLDAMGQVPLMPPNVKGWPGGRMWINTSTLFVRYNTAVSIVGQGRLASLTPAELSQSEVAAYWVRRLIQRPIAPAQLALLDQSLAGKKDESALKKLVGLIVSMPEFQLC